MKDSPRRIQPVWLFLPAIAFMLISASAAAAQTPRPMGIVDLINIPQLADPQISPDGRHVLFTQSLADWQGSRRVTHIWRASVEGGETVQITHGTEGENSPRWAPNGQSIAFVARRGGENANAQIFLLPAEGGEARQLTTHATPVSDISWTPDGRALLFRAPDAKTPAETVKERARDDIYAYDENFKHIHLWKVTVESRVETRVTNGSFSIIAYQLSDDGTKIAYHRAPSPLLGDGFLADIWVANVNGSSAAQITSNRIPEAGATLSPDNSQVLFVSSANEKLESYHNGRLFLVSATGERLRAIAGEREPLDVNQALWSSDGKSIYFLANLGIHEELFVVPAGGGTPKQLTTGKHNLTTMSQSARRFAFVRGDSMGSDIYTLAERDQNLRRITRLSDRLGREFALGAQEALTWKGADGISVEGIVT